MKSRKSLRLDQYPLWILFQFDSHYNTNIGIAPVQQDVVDALVIVHDQNMAHCDIKSDNVILGDDGIARLSKLLSQPVSL